MAEAMESLEALLAHASRQEQAYDWSGAAETYQQAIGAASGGDDIRAAGLAERRARAMYKLALQADDFEDFKKRAKDAGRAYASAKDACVKADGPEKEARVARAKAMATLLRYFEADTGPEENARLEEAWDKAKKALDGFWATRNSQEFCVTCIDTWFVAVVLADLTPDYETRKNYMMEVLTLGERGVELSSTLEDIRLRVGILVMTSCLLERGVVMGLVERDAAEGHASAVDLWRMAESISKEEVLAHLPFAALVGDGPVDPNRTMTGEYSKFLEGAEAVRRSKDRMMIGHLLAGLSFYANWCAAGENVEEVLSDEERALSYALEARDEFVKIGYVTPRGPNIWIMAPHRDHYGWCGYFERDFKRRMEFCERALSFAPETERLALLSGYTIQISNSHLHVAGILSAMAESEPDVSKKRELAKRATDQWAKAIAIYERFDSGAVYNLGLYRLGMAEAQALVASTATDSGAGIEELRRAIDSQRRALVEYETGFKTLLLEEDVNRDYELALSFTFLGRNLCRLVDMTGSKEHLNEASSCFEMARGLFLKSGPKGGALSRAAESQWEMARICDQLEEHEKAAGLFLSASTGFKASAGKMPRLTNTYTDLAAYLDSWAEVQMAKHHHARQEYAQAHERFERAAETLESLPKWRFLASNYRAWATLDKAEANSNDDRWREAGTAFEEAAGLFERSSASLKEAEHQEEEAEVKKLAGRLLKASSARRLYCQARAAIEKAREMNADGRHAASCEMYGRAADDLDKLADAAVTDQDRREMKLVATLAKAWQKMNQAEAELSPEPYDEAARLFEDAKALTANANAKALAIGHSRFCKALEAGARFTDSMDNSLHAAATKNLEGAASYYMKAGADKCAEYARALKLLFDAHGLLDEANQEKDHRKAAKTFSAADKTLQASAEAFGSAGQEGKKAQVTKLMDRVRRDKELAMSIMHVLEAPEGLSSTAPFGAPTPTQETAAGLERFAHAEIQATVIGRPTQLHVGENFSLDIELVNAGRGSAQITKVEKVIPQGFAVQEASQMYRVEDSYLNMRGRRLDPLKTEDVRIILRPTVHGTFRLSPRIMYLDETGKYKSHEPEPVDITVRELGISGWLKGPSESR